jgi:tRNA 2-thiouridine synthesizing protein A
MEWFEVSRSSTSVDAELDVRGLLCPLPVLKARKRLSAMKPGETLRILATDPASAIDFPHWCSQSGHDLVAAAETQGEYSFVIRKNHGN